MRRGGITDGQPAVARHALELLRTRAARDELWIEPDIRDPPGRPWRRLELFEPGPTLGEPVSTEEIRVAQERDDHRRAWRTAEYHQPCSQASTRV